MWSLAAKEKMRQVPKLNMKKKEVSLTRVREENEIEYLLPVTFGTLTNLSLQRVVCTINHLDWVTQSSIFTKDHIHRLHVLDISHSSGITGVLAILLCHSFPSLNNLILCDCGLNSQDLCSLAQASIEGRLPQLTYLDLSRNDSLVENCEHLFSSNANWDTLESLHFQQLKPVSDSIFVCLVKQERLRALQTLKVSVIEAEFPKTVQLPNLQNLVITVPMEHFLTTISNIGDAVERGVVPSLATLVVTQTHGGIGSENMKEIEKEMIDLKTKLEGHLPKEVTDQVMGSIPNSVVNMQNHMHPEPTEQLAGHTPNATELGRLYNLTVASFVSGAIETLRESVTAEQRHNMQSALEVFWWNSMIIAKPDALQSVLNENVLTLPALKLMLRKHNIRLFLYAKVPSEDNDTMLDNLLKSVAPAKKV